MVKRILIISGIAIILIAIVTLVYYLIKRPKAEVAAPREATKLTDRPILEARFLTNQSIFAYSESDSAIYEIGPTQTKQLANYLTFTEKIVWLKPKREVIVEAVNNLITKADNPLYALERPLGSFNFWHIVLGQSQISLLSNKIKEIIWSPSQNKIIYHFQDKENNISIANPDGSQFQKFTLIEPDDRLVGYRAATKEAILLRNSKLTALNAKGQTTELAKDVSDFSIAPDGLAFLIKTEDSWLFDKTKLDFAIDINKLAWSDDGQSFITVASDKKKNNLLLVTNAGERKILQPKDIDVSDIKPQDISSDKKQLVFIFQDSLYKMNIE